MRTKIYRTRYSHATKSPRHTMLTATLPTAKILPREGAVSSHRTEVVLCHHWANNSGDSSSHNRWYPYFARGEEAVCRSLQAGERLQRFPNSIGCLHCCPAPATNFYHSCIGSSTPPNDLPLCCWALPSAKGPTLLETAQLFTGSRQDLSAQIRAVENPGYLNKSMACFHTVKANCLTL